MKLHEETYDVGVIVGRFQVPELHDAHKDLIQTVCDRHDKVIVFLGLSPLVTTKENPLDFESRKQMLLAQFPDINVLYAKDNVSDAVWSKKLDEMVGDVTTPTQSVVLYGSRDSFIKHYEGKYVTAELVQEVYISGSEIRKDIARKSTKASPDWRAGVIWASQNKYPTCYATVDVAILNEEEDRVLLARKEHEKEYRFVGGFSDPESSSYEADARREVAEETGLSITDPVYFGSFLIDDWRYRKEADKIKTLFFVAKLFSGTPRADDDIVELKWFEIATLKPSDVRPEHHVLCKALIDSRAPRNHSFSKI